MSNPGAELRPLIVVIGATGQQGGGVVLALSRSGSFRVKGVTRNPNSAKASEIAQLDNVEVVQGDLEDKASLIKAFQGADGVFLVTDSYGGAKHNPDLEVLQGKNAADAAKEAGVKHLVFSTLEDPRKEVSKDAFREPLPGRIVPHFETKAEIEEYIKELGLPATFLLTCYFYENFINMPDLDMPPRKVLHMDNMGIAAVPMHSVRDIGHSAAIVFGSRQEHLGRTIPVVADVLNIDQACDTIRKEVGVNMHHLKITDEQYWDLPLPGGIAKDLSNMFRYYRLYANVVRAKRPADKAVYKGATFKEWAHEQAGAIRYKKNMGYIPSAIVLMLLAFSWVKHMLLRIVVRMRRVKQE